MRPVENKYTYSDSGNSRDDGSTYYCSVEVTATGYSKSYTWKGGASMEIAIPERNDYRVEVFYYEPFTGCYPNVSMNSKVVYHWVRGFNAWQASYTAEMVYLTQYSPY